MHLAEKLGVRFYLLECFCPDNITRRRLEKRLLKNDNASDGRWDLFQKQKNDFETIQEIPEKSHLKMDTSVHQEMIRHEMIVKIKKETAGCESGN